MNCWVISLLPWVYLGSMINLFEPYSQIFWIFGTADTFYYVNHVQVCFGWAQYLDLGNEIQTKSCLFDHFERYIGWICVVLHWKRTYPWHTDTFCLESTVLVALMPNNFILWGWKLYTNTNSKKAETIVTTEYPNLRPIKLVYI